MTRAGFLVLVLALLTASSGVMAYASELGELPEIPRLHLPEEAGQQLDELQSEVETLREARPLDPIGLAAAYGELGSFCFLYDFLDAAQVAWENAASLQPSAFRWPYLLSALLRIEGDLEAAVTQLERSLAIRPRDLPALIRLARIRIEQGELEAAVDLFSKALAEESSNGAAHYGLGRIAIMEKRYADSLPHLEAALPGQPEGTTVHHQLGLAYRGLGDLDRARDHLSRNRGVRVTFRDPLIEEMAGVAQGARVRARSGIQAQRSGRLDLARRLLDEAARLDPEDGWIRYNLGVVHQESGDDKAAEREYRQAVELDPEYRNAQFNLGELLAAKGDMEGAARHFARAREIDPEDHVAWLEMSVALSRLGDTPGALRELRQLVEAAPSYVEARISLATLLAQVGQAEAALLQVDEVLAGDATGEELAQAHLLRGRIIEPGAASEALEHYRRSVELDGSSAEARRDLAMALGRQGRFDEAAQQFDALVELRPEDSGTRMGQAMALLLGEDYGRALAALEAAHSRFPEEVSLTHSLARLLATCPDEAVRDGERALVLAQRTLQQRQTLEHVETLAMALAETGRFEEAIEWQQRVLEQRRAQGDTGAGAAASTHYLRLFEQRQPVRAPWLGGG